MQKVFILALLVYALLPHFSTVKGVCESYTTVAPWPMVRFPAPGIPDDWMRGYVMQGNWREMFSEPTRPPITKRCDPDEFYEPYLDRCYAARQSVT